uniref:F-box domain-containing protein n=1 Tax=Caenorhabditis tropicalis TaxID=1561998 RepID=A0A1I7TCJ0_9PELO
MTKPLNYDCWSSILDKMDANKRFEISRQCPSLKKLEESLPLYIDYLKFEAGFGPNIMTINGTTYTSGTIRVYPKGSQIPRWHQEENEEGGVAFDFGQMDWEYFDYEEKEFLGLRQYLDYRKGRRPEGTRFLSTSFYKEDSNDQILAKIKRTVIGLQEYYDNRDISRVVYKPMSQLVIVSPDGETITKRSSKRLEECEGKLYKRLFQNRCIINVKCLEINCPYCPPRVPPFLKLKIEELKIQFIRLGDLDAYQQIIDPSCLPLKRIVLVHLGVLKDYEHSLVKSAETMVIQKFPYCDYLELMINVLLQVSNRNVIINQFDQYHITCSILIRRWIDQKRPIGTCWTFELESEETISKTMEETEKHGVRLSERCISIRNDDDSMVRVVYEPSETEAVWVLKWEVVAVEI